MHSTSISLLDRLRQPTDESAWRQFVDLYSPLLWEWGRRAGLQDSDLADLIQDVFVTLMRVLPEFQYDRQKSFRAYLRTMLTNRWRNQMAARRGAATAGPLVDIAAPEFPDPLSEAEYRALVVSQALRIVNESFEPATAEAAQAYLIDGKPAAQVAAELGLSVNSVYLAKSRVLKKLREDLAGFLDE